MKKICALIVVISVAAALFTSCSKNNPSPTPIVVDAGLFQTIHLPTDSATLTGDVKSGQTCLYVDTSCRTDFCNNRKQPFTHYYCYRPDNGYLYFSV